LGALLSARISIETRQMLEAEANRTGRSISQIADTWLAQAASNHASVEEMVGGSAVARSMQRLIALAKVIKESVGDPASDPLAASAWQAGASVIIENLDRDSLSADEIKLATLKAKLSAASTRVLAALDGYPAADDIRDPGPIARAAEGRVALPDDELDFLETYAQMIGPDWPKDIVESGGALSAAAKAYREARFSLERSLALAGAVGRELAIKLGGRSGDAAISYRIEDDRIVRMNDETGVQSVVLLHT
jgi:hypothetical protein